MDHFENRNFQILDPQISEDFMIGGCLTFVAWLAASSVTPLEHPPWFSFFVMFFHPENLGVSNLYAYAIFPWRLWILTLLKWLMLLCWLSAVFSAAWWETETCTWARWPCLLNLRRTTSDSEILMNKTSPMIVLFNKFSQRSAFPRVCWSQRQWKTLTMSLNKCIWTMQDSIWMQCMRLHTVDIRIRSSPHQYSWLSIKSKNKQKWSNMSIQSWLWFPIYLYNPNHSNPITAFNHPFNRFQSLNRSPWAGWQRHMPMAVAWPPQQEPSSHGCRSWNRPWRKGEPSALPEMAQMALWCVEVKVFIGGIYIYIHSYVIYIYIYMYTIIYIYIYINTYIYSYI